MHNRPVFVERIARQKTLEAGESTNNPLPHGAVSFGRSGLVEHHELIRGHVTRKYRSPRVVDEGVALLGLKNFEGDVCKTFEVGRAVGDADEAGAFGVRNEPVRGLLELHGCR